MDTSAPLQSFRTAGVALLAVTIVFMIGAWSAAYFRRWPLPQTSLEQLTAIANDRAGWTAQAILFPVCFLAVALIFGWMAARLPGPWPRWLAVAATLLSTSAFFLWLPISANRLQLGSHAADLLRAYDPSAPLPVLINVNTFWPYTFAALTGIAGMAAALALAGVLPTLGWTLAGLAVAAMAIGSLLMHDWPPFMSYVLVLILAVGLIKAQP